MGAIKYKRIFDSFSGGSGNGGGSSPSQRSAMVDANKTFTSGITEIYTTVVLTVPRTLTPPLANSLPAGTELIFIDEIGGITSTNYVTLTAAGSDTINGSSTQILNVQYGTYKMITDGISKWTLLNNITASEGTWTPSIVGWGSPTIYDLRYFLIGTQCTISGIINGTSNSVNTTISLPFNAKASDPALGGPRLVNFAINAGGGITGMMQVTQNSNTLVCYTTISGVGWSAGGQKTIYIPGFTYTIA